MMSLLQRVLFYGDRMTTGRVRDLLGEMCVQHQRWIATNHPENRVRIEALKASGVNVGNDVFVTNGIRVLDNYKKGAVYIGDRCAFGDSVTLVSASGPNNSLLQYHDEVQDMIYEKPIRILNDVWLGSHVTVLGGVTIGEMCVVGAGSVVTKDLDDYSVYAGIPARKLRSLDKINCDVRT